MKIDIITLFPDMFKGPFDESIVKKAQEKKLVEINLHNLRKWAIDKRGTVDDRPYGGGKGMILRPEPIFDAVKDLTSNLACPPKLERSDCGREPRLPAKAGSANWRRLRAGASNSVILLSPAGKPYTQKRAAQLAKKNHLILICGHYEGVDYRVHKYLADEVVSIGDYVLTGGEIPAMVIVDSIVRLLPGVLEKEATEVESFSPISLNSLNFLASDKKQHVLEFVKERRKGKALRLLECPQYTRPENFRGHKVPQVLLSGNHQEIKKWRLEQALKRTRRLRPDLLSSEK